jgi:orotidine-5'-phosphate decarboxylase
VALDFPAQEQALALLDKIEPASCRMKIGKEMFTRYGPGFVRQVIERGFDVFLDLKYHDIPNTVARSVQAAADLGVWMINVHASGGAKMMSAARDALDDRELKPLLIAVTVLTSMGKTDLEQIGIMQEPAEQVVRLATLAWESGLDGVVCSAQEAVVLRQNIGPDFQLVTPGIRPAGADTQDQTRVMTPAQAIRAGASYLVIGRPITQADNPMDVLLTIQSEIASIAQD